MLLDDARRRLYVASASTDSISIVDVASASVVSTLHDSPPGPIREGSTPNALALSANGRLFVARSGRQRRRRVLRRSSHRSHSDGVVSIALVLGGDSLIVVSAKGKGTAPNPAMHRRTRRDRRSRAISRSVNSTDR